MTDLERFNPEMLALARRSRELTQTQLAKLSGVENATISKYEAGSLPVTNNALSRLAAVLDYPTSFFCRSLRLIGFQGGAVFHRKQQRLPARTLHRAHALAEIRRLEVMMLLDSLEIEPQALPEYPIEFFEDNAEKIARSVRTVMNVPPGPIFNLTKTLELNGCMVIAHDFDSRQIDGFIQRADFALSFIHINSQLPPDRWRWTLAHELGHAVMHFDPMVPPKLAEEEANCFAAEFLTPAHEIGPMLHGLTFQKLGGLKRHWKVSMQALITRAYHLGAISARQRSGMYARLSRAGYRTREPETLDPPVEKPSMIVDLARSHLDEEDFSLDDLRDLLSITEADFRRHYIESDESDDILKTLGIDEILQS